MKSRLFIMASLLALLAGPLSAQKRFYFTPKAGLNVANIFGTGGTDSKAGINVGFTAE